ncbi:MAG TPA: Gfo/Idh/MocA family oxidoreductase [Dehalococcoidia bacterium]|nr:Gfo/Idh/MocA family oxidoreductase [Dehalococcoidia bacterium]
MRVGIIGAGLQGWRRAPALKACADAGLAVVGSAHLAAARRLAAELDGCDAVEGWEAVVERPGLDAVIVCTPPHLHARISIAAMERGLHVLCEKPLARTLAEAEAMVDAATRAGVVLKCGFNHRHHPGIQLARRWLDEGRIGEPIFLRCCYGIGGRPGYEKEWRADPRLVGGGQLMEQGIHAVDLARWFLGELTAVTAMLSTGFWPVQPLEDNAFVLYRAAGGAMASIHSSLTQWKNLFSLEVYGQDGYATVEGLGSAYGTERAVLGRRDFEAPFGEEIVEFRGPDRSWQEEWREFAAATGNGGRPLGDGRDGLEAMRLVCAAYRAAREGRALCLPIGA